MANGYWGYRLIINNKLTRLCTHRLLALTFVEGFRVGLQVNHIDGNKLNNNLDNLEWVTAKENIRHAHRLGLKEVKKKLNAAELQTFWEMRSQGLYWKDAMKIFGISKGSVFNYDAIGRGG